MAELIVGAIIGAPLGLFGMYLALRFLP